MFWMVVKRGICVGVMMVSLVFGCFSQQGGIMKKWEAHFSYSNFTQIVKFNNAFYGVANGSLCSIDRETQEVSPLSKITGLHSSDIARIGYNTKTNSLLIVYSDGGIDIMTSDGIYYVADLANKQMTTSKYVNDIYMSADMAYLSLPFGIVKVNLTKREIADTYYVGSNSSEVNILQVTILHDTIYAISRDTIFCAHLRDNLSDFLRWRRDTFFSSVGLKNIVTYGDSLFLLGGEHVYRRGIHSGWVKKDDTVSYKKIKVVDRDLFFISEYGRVYKNDINVPVVYLEEGIEDITLDGRNYWAVCNNSLVYCINEKGEHSTFFVDGPATNNPYRMHTANGWLYVVPGGRWAAQNFSAPYIFMYNGRQWFNIYPGQIIGKTNKPAYDFMNVAVDPFDPEHFFVTSYGTGIYEFKQMSLYRHYDAFNSPLGSANNEPLYYTRTDAAFYDEEGNLWVINVGNQSFYNLHIIKPADIITEKEQYTWFYSRFMERPSSSSYLNIDVPQEIIVDKTDSRYKWIPQARPGGLFLFFDNGTIFNSSDDYTIYRNNFVDQDNNPVSISALYSAIQDREGVIWLGTDNGIVTISSLEDFGTSNRCEKIKIPRNDGSDLADFLLEGKQINALGVDGANRKWIATAGSGVYLMSEDGQQTIEHFTKENSPLPTNEIISLAVEPQTGRVFIGTAKGLLSYQSDASEGEERLKSSTIYAFPNPVRPGYEGYITIKGLMENTVVYITDSYGNLVCKTNSNGGIAIWDGRNAVGNKVPSGVYTAMCNTTDGKNHALCKILIMN